VDAKHKALRPFVRAGRRWLSHSWVDLFIIVLVPSTHFALQLAWDFPDLLHTVPASRRPGLYGAASMVVSLAGTLASVTVVQYLSNRGDRMRELKRLYPRSLASTWRGVFIGSVSAAVLFLVAYALDSRDNANGLGVWIFEVGVVLALLRFIRLAILFGELIQIIVLDDTDPIPSGETGVIGQFVSSGSTREKFSQDRI
jgi:hypothetical protein